jgi:CRISPR type III-B/RAMP module-associated protein Cmr3
MTLLQVRLEPVDPMLFGDNRSARAGEDHTLSDQDPSPATLYGAIGARIASRLGARGRSTWNGQAKAVLGSFEPDLGQGSPDRAELCGYAGTDVDGRLWFPRPLHFRVSGSQRGGSRITLPALRPVGAAEAEREKGLSSLSFPRRLHAPEAESSLFEEDDGELLVDESRLGEILASPESTPLGDVGPSVRTRAGFYAPEPRLGLAMDNAANLNLEGRFFSRPYRRYLSGFGLLEPAWRSAGFTAWYRVRELAGQSLEDWNGLGFFGGDRRRVELAFAPEAAPLARLRDQVLAAVPGSLGFVTYLLTPAVDEGHGVRLEGTSPFAAAVGRPVYTSGWNSAEASPRPILTLIPAGSVYFFAWPAGGSEESRREMISRHWLAPLSEAYRNSGFGRILPGVWR